MRKRTTLAAVALTLLAAGCGQQQSSQRAAVASYLKQVNKLESGLTRPLATVTTTGNEFAHEERAGGSLTNLVTGSHEQALRGALRKITALRVRLAAVKVPPAAGRLRSLLLEIVDGQAQLTREVAKLVAFLPRFSATLQPLAPATSQLQRTLAQRAAASPGGVTAAYASKAAALRRFKRAVDGVVTKLRRLEPPAVSRPQYETQLASLNGMSSNAGRLANALADGPQGNVQRSLDAFDHAATLNQTISAQKAQIAAVRAYDRQSTRLQHLSQAAEEERLRLADTLS